MVLHLHIEGRRLLGRPAAETSKIGREHTPYTHIHDMSMYVCRMYMKMTSVSVAGPPQAAAPDWHRMPQMQHCEISGVDS